MFNINIINFLLINIKFYLNIKYKLTHNFNIFINKHNLNNKIIFNYLKTIKNNFFNFRNKLNFNKSKRNLTSSQKKTGKARIGSSSSHILKDGLLWFGFRNIKLKKCRYYKNLLKFILIKKKKLIDIKTVELIKFIYNIKFINFNSVNFKTTDKQFNNVININKVNRYINMFNSLNTINFLH